MDQAIIQMTELLARFDNDRDFIAELLAGYAEDVSADLPRLERAIASGDKEQVIMIGHSLKGISANIALDELARVFAEIEQMGKSGVLAGAPAAFAECVRLFDKFRAELNDMQGTGS